MTTHTKEYWIDSIKGGIESYLNHMIDDSEDGEDIISKIPCLCVEEWPKAFQVIVKFKYNLDVESPMVYNQEILDYEIPYQFVHGYTTGEIEKIKEVINEIVDELNKQYKG